MRIPNRSAIVIRPRQPYIRWAETLHSGTPNLTIRSRVAVYLLDEPSVRKEGPFVERFSPRIFEIELSACAPNEADWPTDRSAETFREWFEISMELGPIDLGQKPIVVRDL